MKHYLTLESKGKHYFLAGSQINIPQRIKTKSFEFILQKSYKSKLYSQNPVHLIFLLVIFSLFSLQSYSQAWYNTSWNFRKPITIDYTKVATGPHTDFPVLIKITDAQLSANALASGFDILFTASDGLTKLNYDRESFNKATGELVAWVKIPSLSSASDTMILMYYGNAAATDQQQATLVYDSTYQGVWHMNDATNQLDATSNNRTGTNSGSIAATGLAANGRDFEKTNSTDRIDVGIWNVPATTGLTLQCWVKFETVIDSDDPRLISKSLNSSTENNHVFMLSMVDPGRIRMRLKTGVDDANGTTTLQETTAVTYPLNEWHFLVATYDRSFMRLFRNGVQVASVAKTGDIGQNDWSIHFGNNPGSVTPLDGVLDEVRISSVARSAEWLLTEYRNINSPSTFYSVGAESCNLPATPGVINQPTNKCSSTVGNIFSVAAVSGASSYTWSVTGTGWAVTAGGTTTSATITIGTGIGTVSVTATNGCGTSTARSTGNITPTTIPATPGTINQPTNKCSGTVGNIFSIAAVSGASSYTWSVTGTGWAVTAGGTTTSATITIGTGIGTVSVTATNGCGTSTARSTGNITPTTIPATPGTINQPTNKCSSTVGNIFSIAAVSGASSYTWSVTGTGWAVTAGGTTTSATITIGTGIGTVSVTATNGCGTSTARSTGNITPTTIPATPGVINQPTNKCSSTVGNIFSIAAVSGASSYTWSVTGTGWAVTSGGTTTSATITIGTGIGTVSVTATNGCGTSAASTTGSITPTTIPATPGTINQPTNKCSGTVGNIFSIAAVSGASSYTWSVTGTGWAVTAGGTTTSATITIGTGIGTVSVTATNGCGTSAASTTGNITATVIPATPGTITQPTNKCSGTVGNTFSIAAVSGASSYTWSVTGTGWAVTAGGTTTSATITIGTGIGTVSVTATNGCGTSAASTTGNITPTTIPVTPGTITGSAIQCPSVTGQTYSIDAVPNATTYIWTVPTGWTITAGSTTTSITVTTGSGGQNGNITVAAGNTCGTSTAQTLEVIVNVTPIISPNKVNETCPASNNGSISPVLSGGITNVRYIKITQKYADWQQVQEIQAFEIFTGTNVALTSNGASATSSSNYSNNAATFGPQKAIDGDFTGYSFWHSNSTNTGEYIIVDLTSAKNIDYLRIYNRVDCCWNRGQNMLLELFDASNNLVYSKTVDLYGGVNGSHYVDVNVLDVSWADATTTLNRTALDSGSYTLNYTDAVGCSVSSPINISSANTPPLAPTLSTVTQPTCTTSTGSFTITNYNASYTYTVTPSTGVTQSGNTITAPEGSYTVTATLASCDSTASESVVINAQPANDWNGSVSLDWNNPANWCAGVPTVGVPNTLDVIIQTGLANYPIIYSGNPAGYVKTLEMEINTTLNVRDNSLRVTDNLKLDGKIDLEGESQLLQDLGSTLDPTSSGSLERDQQGTADTYTYNYWSSPVGLPNNTTNNNSYNLPNIFQGVNFLTSGYNGSTSPLGIADYWIWKYSNLQSNNYSLWQHVRSTGTLLAGEGFTMKGPGTGSISTPQNYVLLGKPNNGDINLIVNAGNDYLVGNPYPSALDANQFILDNGTTIAGPGSTTGTLYFWEHWGGGSHNLRDYQGGYATYSLAGGVPAAAMGTNDPNVGTGGTPTKTPGRYIPVAQGFFVTAESSGTIKFNNGQRVFQTEDGINSVFVKSANTKSSKSTNNQNSDTREKIRLGFNSVNTIRRQLLITVDPIASIGYDWGYDAPNIDELVDDMYWLIDSSKYTIQGIDKITEQTILPLGIHTKINGLNSITIDNIENTANNLKIYLHDKQLNIYHDLKEKNYTVNLMAGEYLNRFEITFSTPQTLETENVSIIDKPIDVYFSNEEKNIIIDNPNSKYIESIEMFNILGQFMFKFETDTNKTYLKYNVSQIKTGTYIFKIKTKYGKISKKVLIN